MAATEEWMCRELVKLGIDASLDIAQYILSIETGDELREYMLELLDGSEDRNLHFIDELVVRWRVYNDTNKSFPENVQVYKKANEEENFIAPKEKKRGSNVLKERKAAPVNLLANTSRCILPGEESSVPVIPFPEKAHSKEKEVKKKQKFVPLYSKEGQSKSIVQLPGRHVCECQAAKHSLINNCTKCGRIVCEQEGPGPCLYCGNLVCTSEQEEILSRGSKKSDKLRQSLMKDTPTTLLGSHAMNGDRDYLPQSRTRTKEEYMQANKHKEKLLEYDRTSVRRTQVIDDESDYFSTDSNQWLSTADRELLRKREEELRSVRHASRKDRKITLDFAGRQIVEEDPSSSVNMYNVNDEVVQMVNFGARPKKTKGSDGHGDSKQSQVDDYLVNPTIHIQAPKFVPQGSSKKQEAPPTSQRGPTVRTAPRIQDRELQEMSDGGMCMSMHQPWASLLTSGIKIHEGRSWYTAHRGRLWIAATAKTPDPAEISDMEKMYQMLYKNAGLNFPGHYPVGCLLGCVDVVDCLSQDVYQEKFPEGESGSPFVFICENPRELVVKFPIKGKHKIYKLEGDIHAAAKKGLR